MCGIVGIIGTEQNRFGLRRMVDAQTHRGPDDRGTYVDKAGRVALGHTRLSIIDLSSAGHQPIGTPDGEMWLVFNGEIYNHLELRAELNGYDFRSHSDSEVLLAAYQRWGKSSLDRLIGMFAFVIWDEKERKLFAARDRFGVKPLYVHYSSDGGGLIASEIKALHAIGVPRRPDPVSWATFFVSGLYDHGPRTFWEGVRQVPPGSWLEWTSETGWRNGTWYDVADSAKQAGPDLRQEDEVADETLTLLEESVKLRFRSDVPIGICLSGGLDSSLLVELVRRVQGDDSEVDAFTFYCDDPTYDELPWVRVMLRETRHRWHRCLLDKEDIPSLAEQVQRYQDEPFGGFPTLGMARVFDAARKLGVTVLLDGNGLDEGWAGYEYYQRSAEIDAAKGPVQGARSPSTNSDCLRPEFATMAESFEPPRPFDDALLDLQYRDLRYAKIPRAVRFNDRASMMFSREVREPFLDHRIVELGLRQPASRKIRNGVGKWLMRRVARRLLPEGIREAPKRPVQTPQREWLRGDLSIWAEAQIEEGLSGWGRDWLDDRRVRTKWQEYRRGGADNSFPIWQWINLGLMRQT